jgi:hypothetical protein
MSLIRVAPRPYRVKTSLPYVSEATKPSGGRPPPGLVLGSPIQRPDLPLRHRRGGVKVLSRPPVSAGQGDSR